MTKKIKIELIKQTPMKFIIFTFAILFSAALFLPSTASAQRRDQLTDMESDLVREAQTIDSRSEVYVKAIDRRFLVLNNDASQAKRVQKDLEKWGELPTGTRGQLLIDIEKILQEAIDNIDNVAERDQKSELMPKAVRVLANASSRFLPELKAQLDKPNTEIEKGAILGAIDSCSEIIEASARLPKEETKKKKKN